MPTGTVGAISELVVAVDLLRKGYEVFRALSVNASCDLAIIKDGVLLRIEVRTAHTNKNGAWGSNPKHRADILAQVVGNEIKYTPPF